MYFYMTAPDFSTQEVCRGSISGMMKNGHAHGAGKASQMAHTPEIQPCFLWIVPSHTRQAGSVNLR